MILLSLFSSLTSFYVYFLLVDLHVHSKFDSIFDTLDLAEEIFPICGHNYGRTIIYSSLGTDLESFTSQPTLDSPRISWRRKATTGRRL